MRTKGRGAEATISCPRAGWDGQARSPMNRRLVLALETGSFLYSDEELAQTPRTVLLVLSGTAIGHASHKC